ncbi:hypothetical protein [Pseudomonas denitrificans (nom. rej.)]|uniref:Uncharacterized protein n=1 Tax=Pseudomonas denitrificans TaxID=43306 RepID=A0A9X7MZZ2_PSEDE|nr:hypothetical protein [Pseudomonas denitrificans (nom. rej.)]QEY72131.1 hypothetical protein F1C79_11195 [Pseudomonas denitrificans (nom. rej.)]
MANADDTTPPTPRPAGPRFIPLATTSQHSYFAPDAALFLRADAPDEALYDAAEDRMSAALDMLAVLERVDQDDAAIPNVFLICRALLLLISDAQSLYQAEHDRRRRRA